MENKFTVSVVIPTYEPSEKFLQLLKRLQRQTYPIEQICVINTRTKNFPTEEIEVYENVKFMQIEPTEFDHGETRNRGAACTRGDIIVFMTQDAVPVNPYLIENLVDFFEKSSHIGVVYARQIPEKGCGVIERYTRSFNYPKESIVKSKEDIGTLGIKTFFCSNVCAAYKRDVFESLDGFPGRAIFNEDMIFAGKVIQSGYKVAYCAKAEVIHSHDYSCMQQLKRNFDVAVSQVEHPEIFEEIHSETEGIKLVKQTIKYLICIRKPWLVCQLITKSGFKYIGYFLGKRYKRIPQWIVLKLTMNPRYWGKS